MSARTRGTAFDVDLAEHLFREAEWDAQPRWKRGEVVPARITMLLDAKGLYGPEVDAACGVREPAVDEWEAGTRYPTFSQLVALARLVEATPMWFFGEVHPITGPVFVCGRPRARFGAFTPPPPITAYPEEVWRPVVDGLTDTLFDLTPNGAMH